MLFLYKLCHVTLQYSVAYSVTLFGVEILRNNHVERNEKRELDREVYELFDSVCPTELFEKIKLQAPGKASLS